MTTLEETEALTVVGPTNLEIGSVYAYMAPDEHTLTTLSTEQWQPEPNRTRRKVEALSVDSFVAYFARHHVTDVSEVWADTKTMQGVIDAPTRDHPRWTDHIVTYTPVQSPQWRRWVEFAGKFHDQTTFAEFIEDNTSDIYRPAAADILEIAQSLHVTTSAQCSSTKILATGEVSLTFVEEHTATSGGKSGTIEVPRQLDLFIRVYENASKVVVPVALRYRLRSGAVSFSVVIPNAADVARRAFDALVADAEQQLGKATKAKILRGSPGRCTL